MLSYLMQKVTDFVLSGAREAGRPRIMNLPTTSNTPNLNLLMKTVSSLYFEPVPELLSLQPPVCTDISNAFEHESAEHLQIKRLPDYRNLKIKVVNKPDVPNGLFFITDNGRVIYPNAHANKKDLVLTEVDIYNEQQDNLILTIPNVYRGALNEYVKSQVHHKTFSIISPGLTIDKSFKIQLLTSKTHKVFNYKATSDMFIKIAFNPSGTRVLILDEGIINVFNEEWLEDIKPWVYLNTTCKNLALLNCCFLDDTHLALLMVDHVQILSLYEMNLVTKSVNLLCKTREYYTNIHPDKWNYQISKMEGRSNPFVVAFMDILPNPKLLVFNRKGLVSTTLLGNSQGWAQIQKVTDDGSIIITSDEKPGEWIICY